MSLIVLYAKLQFFFHICKYYGMKMVFFVHLECGMQGVVICYVMMDTSDVPPIFILQIL